MSEYSSAIVCMSRFLWPSGGTLWLVADAYRYIYEYQLWALCSYTSASLVDLHPLTRNIYIHTHTLCCHCNVNDPVAWSPGRFSRRLFAFLSHFVSDSYQHFASAFACIFAHYPVESFPRLHASHTHINIHGYIIVWQFLRVAFSCVYRNDALAAAGISKTFRRSNSFWVLCLYENPIENSFWIFVLLLLPSLRLSASTTIWYTLKCSAEVKWRRWRWCVLWQSVYAVRLMLWWLLLLLLLSLLWSLLLL